MKKVKEQQMSEKISEADKIWAEIKNLPLDMFSLPNQSIEKYCTPQYVEPSKLYVNIKVGSVLPALESALEKTHKVESAGRFVVIYRK